MLRQSLERNDIGEIVCGEKLEGKWRLPEKGA